MTEHDLRGTTLWDDVEDYFRRLHEPTLGRPHKLLEPSTTPDGSAVALTGFVHDVLEGAPRRGAFLLRGRELAPLVHGAAATSPRFSPDGTRLALLSDHVEEGVPQLVVLSGADLADRVEAPAVPGSVESLRWSPDGARVLLGVAGRGADLAGAQGSGTTKAGPVDVPAWFPSVDAGVSEDAWRTVHVLDLATNELRRWSPEGLNVWEAAWLGPDTVLAIASDSPSESAWYAAPLVTIAADGTVTELLGSDVQLGLISAAPGGARIAVVQAVCSDRGVLAGDLLVGEPDGLRAVDTLGVDVTATSWIDDDRLGFAGLRGLETVIGVHDVRTEKSEERWASLETSCGWRYPDVAWTADGDAVVVEEGYALPQRVVRVPADGGRPVELLVTGDAGTEHLMAVAGTAAPVSWAAPDGLRIEGLLCLPDGEGPFPLVVNIHGGPVWAFRNTWQMFYPTTPLLVSRGYAVLNPNPRGSGGRGQEFARRVFGDMGGADTHDFTSGVDALVERGIVDPERVGLVGGSYGGFMSAWLPTQDQRWAAAVPIAPVTDWYSQHFTSNIPHFDALFLDGDPEVAGDRFHERSPVFQASSVRTPCLTIAGELDRCTPPGQALELHQALVEHGVESQCVIYPGEGHGVRSFPAIIDYAARIVGWFERHMPARPAS